MNIIKRFRISDFLNNAYLIQDNNKTILIDAPKNIGKIIKYLNEHYLELNEIWLTHIHYDHIAGLQTIFDIYPNIKVYLSDQEIKLINDSNSTLAHLFGEKDLRFDIEFHDASLLENDNICIKFISGHSKKSTVYIFKNEKVMFSGDVLFKNSIGRSDLIYGDQEKLVSGINEHLLGFDGFEVYPGHGFSTTIENEKKGNVFLNG